MAKIVLKRANRHVEDEAATIAWAKAGIALLRRSLAAVERADGAERAQALLALDAIRKRSPGLQPASRSRLGRDRKDEARAKASLRRVYDAALPVVKGAKTYFLPFLDEGVGGVTDEDVSDWVKKRPRAGKVATGLRFAWSAKLVTDLCKSKPSEWVMHRIGRATGYSHETIRSLLHRSAHSDRGTRGQGRP